MEIAIDIETYSNTDIKAGVHKYVEDPAFTILMIAYSFDQGENVCIIDLASGEKIPLNFIEKLADKAIIKTAYNAAFEIACLSKYFKINLDPKQWSCTMALAAQVGLPFGLDMVAKVLKTDAQKDSKGKELIKYFTMPCKPTFTNGMRVRNMPEHNFEKWLDFMQYCIVDVKTETAIKKQLSWFTVSDFEKEVWALDQKINNVGVKVDMQLVDNSILFEKQFTQKLIEQMSELTDIKNPKSNAQVKKFIEESTGVLIASLNKAAMPDVNERFKDTPTELILSIREKLSRSSVKKYNAMQLSACSDDRIRGLFQYYGANRTGRWAGRNVQVQNLPRNNLKDLDFARSVVKKNNLTVLELSYDDVGSVLSNLIRTAFIPSKGNMFVVSDLSAIEARITAWYADEKWRLDVFATHGKIYEASASQMFKIPIESVTKEIRMKGKISELALGYQGAVGALERMGANAMGLTSEELPKLVRQWRNANKQIVKLWYEVQACFIEAIVDGKSSMKHGLLFERKNNNLIITLPSGRQLVYISCSYKLNKITYYGLDQTTRQWTMQDTYGGKLVENIVQATARDVLTDAMIRADKAGFKIVMHVHDEIVADHPTDESKKLNDIMSAPLHWAPGLPLGAETFIANYYQK